MGLDIGADKAVSPKRYGKISHSYQKERHRKRFHRQFEEKREFRLPYLGSAGFEKQGIFHIRGIMVTV